MQGSYRKHILLLQWEKTYALLGCNLGRDLTSLALVSCNNTAEVDGDAQSASPALTQLPVSTNATMVGLIDNSADYIWTVGNGDMPRGRT